MKHWTTCLFLFFWVIFTRTAAAQKSVYQSVVVAFYNLENFYDTINDPSVNDEDFLPDGIKAYTAKVYEDRLHKLATVIAEIAEDVNGDGPALLGVAEVENNTVLNDLVHEPLLEKRNYQFVHFDSRDARGIDVALIYNPRYFKVITAKALYVPLPESSKDAFFTRDILWVTGMLCGERVNVFVNHWPSRYGGEKRSMPAREAAAKVARQYIDALFKNDQRTKIILMGDLNDEPVSKSITETLFAGGKRTELRPGELFDPWVALYRKGLGSLAYHDAWSLFDQIIISQTWLEQKQNGFFFYQNKVFKKPFMIENVGPYKGYPKRSYSGNAYIGGYSDHFPTYIIFLKKIRDNL